jgi:hypothetical protein
MKTKKAPGLAIIIGGPKRPERDRYDDGEDEEPVADEAKRSAMEDLIRAVGRKDVSAGVAALDSYLEACGYGDDGDEESADDKEE